MATVTHESPPADHPRTPPPPPRLSAGKQALFAVICVVVILLGIEGAVRAYHWARNLGADDTPAHGYVHDDAQAGYVLTPGYDQGGVRVNALGFRGPEITQAKPAGTYRIVTVGDSATWGPTEQECSYPYQLAGLLPGRNVQVVNAAIEGYRSDRALVHLRRDVMPLQPDLVTVFIGWNDLYQTDPNSPAEQLTMDRTPLERLLDLSDAAQTFRRLYFLHFQTARAQTSGLSADEQAMLSSYRPLNYGDRLRQIFQTARGGGAQVVAITWPTILSDNMTPDAQAKVQYPWYSDQLPELKLLYADYQAELRQVAAEQQVPVVDAAADFNALPDKAALFKDAAHFSCDGQTIIAQDLANQLAHGLVPNFPS